MTERREGRFSRRLSDWQIIVGLVATVGGIAWAIGSYPIRWEKMCDTVDQIAPQVWKNKDDIQGVRLNMAVINAQYATIEKHLDRIDRQTK